MGPSGGFLLSKALYCDVPHDNTHQFIGGHHYMQLTWQQHLWLDVPRSPIACAPLYFHKDYALIISWPSADDLSIHGCHPAAYTKPSKLKLKVMADLDAVLG